MLLTIDIGNTSITFGLFEKDLLSKKFRLKSNLDVTEYKTLIGEEISQIDSCIISSVKNEMDYTIKNIIDELFGINSIILKPSLDLGFEIKIDTPNCLGTDRIANTAGVKVLNHFPAVVADCGTATTIDVIDKNGNFAGGVIMAGIELQLKSLGANTSKLPELKPEYCPNVICKNTKDAILSGVIGGHAQAIKGIIEKCTKELGEKPYVILTGGFSSLIQKYIPECFDSCDINLTLKGLKFIHDRLSNHQENQYRE